MKLRALKEASPLHKYPLQRELFRRAHNDKRSQQWKFNQQDIGQFAADLDVEYNALGKRDLKRVIWEGMEGMKDNPQLVEEVYKEFIQVYLDDYTGEDRETIEDARDEAFEELVDDFFVFMLNKKSRWGPE